MHSQKFDKVKRYYGKGFWGKKQVHDAVKMGWITATEYTEIVGETYIAGG